MKKIASCFKITALSFLFITQFFFAARAGDDKPGIKFRPITFEEALAASKMENKPVFVHGFADWCHFCMYMQNVVYPDSAVGAFYNANFVCVKIDMEKEGKEMNKTLKIHSFPTFLFYDSTGEVIHRASGRRVKIPFIELGREALDPRRNLRGQKIKYESGTSTPWEVQYYFRNQEYAGMDAQAMIDDYLMKQPDSSFTNQNNWTIMNELVKDPNLAVVKRMADRKKELESTYTVNAVNEKFITFCNIHLMQHVQLLDSAGYEEEKNHIRSLKKLDLAEEICAFADLNRLKMKSDWPAYKIMAPKFIEQYAKNDFQRINDVAGICYDRFNTDNQLMSLAEKWMQQSVNLSDQYKSNHLLACIEFVLVKKEQALTIANHALELAKRDGLDARQTLQLLDDIQKMP